MEIVEAEGLEQIETIEGGDEDVTEDSKLYIAELKEHMLVEGEDVFGNSKGTLIVSDHLDNENMEEGDAVEHIIIDGQVSYIFKIWMSRLEWNTEFYI